MRGEGFYVVFGDEIGRAVNGRVQALHRALRADLPPAVTDLCPGYTTLYVEYNAEQTTRSAVAAWVRRHLNAVQDDVTQAGRTDQTRTIEIPVRYDGADLADVAVRTGLDPAEVIRRHTAPTYHVYAVGFTPGFPFLGEVESALRLPRRSTPRLAVPLNAVAIAGAQTCVYPLPSPGGWNLLGTALRTLYDPNRPEPCLLAPGDAVRFVPGDGPAPTLPPVRPLWPETPAYPALRVEKPGLLDVLVDAGRFRQAQVGMARGGPLDPRAANLANRLAGNPPGTPLLELTLLGPVLTALRDLRVAVAGFGMTAVVGGEPVPPHSAFGLRAGETLRFRPAAGGTRSYLAVASGLETLPFLGSSSVDLTGRVGRALRTGDVLGIGEGMVATGYFGDTAPPLTPPRDEVRLRLLPGPQASYEALVALASAPFTVREQDRMGVRLEGPEVPGGGVVSEATPHGAVQVTPAGQPILLLNDRGRLGGYHKPAVIHPDDLPLAAQLRPNQRIVFRPLVSGPPHGWARRWVLDPQGED
ncbi:5-oxoprolinase subunit PxpB [Deinococcus sp. Leaf326]|uniref:5-oxoprolinase subunit PxpB n=1 Tax=Deinococcus sp. Leaf326 TaxID=1736338 RepID=UPI0006F60C56|nr:5-oxoprolinase subunit PxpB [Deinococcus sp. Leaf326]KQR22810.1 urea carboxylase [Deinococcus sp. Leaf326]